MKSRDNVKQCQVTHVVSCDAVHISVTMMWSLYNLTRAPQQQEAHYSLCDEGWMDNRVRELYLAENEIWEIPESVAGLQRLEVHWL